MLIIETTYTCTLPCLFESSSPVADKILNPCKKKKKIQPVVVTGLENNFESSG